MYNILTYKEFLITEKEETDKAYRTEAIKIFKLIHAVIDKEAKSIIHHPSIPVFIINGYVMSWLDGQDIFFSGGKYDELEIRFLPRREDGIRAENGRKIYSDLGVTRITRVIDLFLLEGDESKTDLKDILNDNDSFVIHELIHYIDRTQRKIDVDAHRFKDRDVDEFIKYFNSPMEYNAYYQQLTYVLDKVISNSPAKVLAYEFPKDFKSFLEKAKLKAHPGWLQHMSPETYKRFVKRLYDYHQTVILPLWKSELQRYDEN